MGSTVYRCGICGNRLYALTHHSGQLLYGCKPSKHLTRQAAPVDEYVTDIVLGVLSREGIAAQLSPRPDIDVAALHARRTALVAQKNQLARLLVEHVLDEAGVRSESEKLTDQITGIDTVLAQAVVTTSPSVALLADGVDRLQANWDAASPDIKGKVVDELMTVTLLPSPRGKKAILTNRESGVRTVDPDFIRIEPKV